MSGLQKLGPKAQESQTLLPTYSISWLEWKTMLFRFIAKVNQGQVFSQADRKEHGPGTGRSRDNEVFWVIKHLYFLIKHIHFSATSGVPVSGKKCSGPGVTFSCLFQPVKAALVICRGVRQDTMFRGFGRAQWANWGIFTRLTNRSRLCLLSVLPENPNAIFCHVTTHSKCSVLRTIVVPL